MTLTEAVARKDQAPAQLTPRQVLMDLVERNKNAIGLSLPTSMNRDRFARLLLTAANTNPELIECDPKSFLAAGVTCAQLGLEPNDPRGLAYLVPFKDKARGRVVQTIIGYRGMLELARRSGQVGAVHAQVVREGDEFDYRLGLDPDVHHVPTGDEDARLTHAYAVAKIRLPGSDVPDTQFVVLTRKQVEKAKAKSRGADSQFSPWRTNEPEMWCKTALRRLCKLLPQTVEVAQAVENDERPMVLGDLGIAQPIPYDDDEKHPDALEAGATEEVTS